MARAKQTGRVTTASRDTLLTMLETLPDALFLMDDTDAIVYTNRSAQAMLDATPEALYGQRFWQRAPHVVSLALYQAVRQARESGESTAVEYVSAITQNGWRASLTPAVGGLLLQFHEVRAPARHQEMLPQGDCLHIEDLAGLQVGILTPTGIVLDVNQIPSNDPEIPREEVIGKFLAEAPWWSCSPASQEQLRAAVARASAGEPASFEVPLPPKEGMARSFEGVITPHLNADHQAEYLIIVGIDGRAHKQAERDIHPLIDTIPQFVWIARPDGSITYNNRRLTDYLALTQEQVKGAGWLVGVHPDDRRLVWEAWQTSIQTGVLYEVEQRLQDGTSGAYRWFLARGVPLRNAQGVIMHWVGTCTDIEDQKRTEQQLKASEENWRVLAETVPQLVWTMRADGLSDYFNQRFCRYTHATWEQLRGYGWSQFLHQEDHARTLAARERAFRTGTPYEVEYRFREGQTGSYRWFLARAMPVRDATGQILKWFGTCTDIEDQKRTEEALRQSQERIRALIDSNIIGITSIEVEGEVFVEANDAFLRMTGYTREDIRGRMVSREKIAPPDQAPLFEHAIQEVIARGQHTPFETELVCKDGSRLPVLVGGVLFQQHPRRLVSFMLDNSARKELEQRKDVFISMASHELRNPLTALKLQTSLLQRQLAKQGIQTSLPTLAGMETQLNKLTRLVEDLLDVSKMQAGKLEYVQEVVDLDTLLQEITETLQQTSPNHTLVVHGAAQASLVGDRDRLGQVFTNLITNAIKYSPGAETIEIDLSTSADAIAVSVRDHGLGIPREQRDKIFDRFYRVTDVRQKTISGLGMGLYIVAEIVKSHEGYITVDSIVGEGSTFTVTFPRMRTDTGQAE